MNTCIDLLICIIMCADSYTPLMSRFYSPYFILQIQQSCTPQSCYAPITGDCVHFEGSAPDPLMKTFLITTPASMCMNTNSPVLEPNLVTQGCRDGRVLKGCNRELRQVELLVIMSTPYIRIISIVLFIMCVCLFFFPFIFLFFSFFPSCFPSFFPIIPRSYFLSIFLSFLFVLQTVIKLTRKCYN